MRYDLTDEYLEDARRRAYRFQGQWRAHLVLLLQTPHDC